jgi:hypothetical protein
LHDGPALVVTPLADVADVLDLDDAAPPMRRDMEILAAATDSDRHVTLLVAPKSLLIEGGKGIFDGVAQRLEEPLGWLLGEHATAMELSLHWGDDFFLELRAAATIDTRAHRLADQLAGRMDELPVRLESLLLSLDVQPYGQRLLFRLPEMTRAAVRYSRHGFEEGHAMVRTCLPITAGHNLLMAGELALVEPLRNSAAAVPVSHSEPQTIEERLAATTSLSFARDTLETALQLLAEEMGVEIRINGEDLRAEGITRNQSFGIDLIDRPGSEILGEILRLANPDKTATGLDDPRQKLVYVVRKEASGRPAGLVVTTRAAAAGRGETLPDVFLTP